MNTTHEVHLRFTLKGEPARILKELKERGIIKTYQEGVRHALYEYKDLIDQRDKNSRLLLSDKEKNEV